MTLTLTSDRAIHSTYLYAELRSNIGKTFCGRRPTYVRTGGHRTDFRSTRMAVDLEIVKFVYMWLKNSSELVIKLRHGQ